MKSSEDVLGTIWVLSSYPRNSKSAYLEWNRTRVQWRKKNHHILSYSIGAVTRVRHLLCDVVIIARPPSLPPSAAPVWSPAGWKHGVHLVCLLWCADCVWAAVCLEVDEEQSQVSTKARGLSTAPYADGDSQHCFAASVSFVFGGRGVHKVQLHS